MCLVARKTCNEIQSGILADNLAAMIKQRSREWGPLFRTKKRHRQKTGNFVNQLFEQMMRWRKLNRARGSMKPSFGMEHYYTEIS